MTIHPATTTSSEQSWTHTEPVVGREPSRIRRTMIASALGLAAIAEIAVLLLHPWEERNQFGYSQLAPIRDAMWTALLVDALAFGVLGVALSLVVCLLAPGRGSVWANVGAVAATVGGIAFAMGAFGFSALVWYSTETAAIPAGAGTTFLAFAVDNPVRVLAPQMAGFLLFTVGTVLSSVALLRARSVPRWLPVGLLLLTGGTFLPVPSRALDLVQVTFMVLLVVLAWRFQRSGPPVGR